MRKKRRMGSLRTHLGYRGNWIVTMLKLLPGIFDAERNSWRWSWRASSLPAGTTQEKGHLLAVLVAPRSARENW